MWEISVNAQVLGTLYAVPVGAAFCLFYDIIRIFRKSVKPRFAIDFLLDVFFWIICAFVTFCLMLIFSSGQLRWYIFFGLLVGFLIFRFTLSRLIILLSFRIIDLLTRFFSAVNCLLTKIFTKVSIFFRKIFDFFIKIAKKLLQPLCKVLYNLRVKILSRKVE